MPAKERVRSAADVLIEALAAAQEQHPEMTLAEVRFWPYAAVGAGWGWSIRFSIEVGIDKAERGDSFLVRASRIVHAWDAEREKQRAQELADQAALAAQDAEGS